MAKSMYKLICSICAHPCTGVRCMAICDNGSVVTAGYEKEKCAKLWIMFDNTYINSVEMTGHERNVTCVCSITDQSCNMNFIITGSNDMHVCFYNFGESTPLKKVKAHKDRLCCINGSNFHKNNFLTSSYDNLVKLWDLRNFESPEAVLFGHSCTPLCVTDLPSGLIVSSSSSFLLIHSREGNLIQKLMGHRLSVRDICAIGDNEFLSCDNDGAIKHWNVERCVTTYQGHRGFVHGVSALPQENLMVSCGADRAVRIWCNGVEEQTINFPANAVKFVKIFENQDIVCGSSDGYVRIFSANTHRYGDPEVHKTFVKEVERFDPCFKDNFEDQGNTVSSLQDVMSRMRKVTIENEDDPMEGKSTMIESNNDPNEEDEKEEQQQVWTHAFGFQIQDNAEVAQKFIDDHDFAQNSLERITNKILNYKNLISQPPAPLLLPKKDYLEQTTYDFESIRRQIVSLNYGRSLNFNHRVPSRELALALDLANNAVVTPEALRVLKKLLYWPEPCVLPVLNLVGLAVLRHPVNDELCDVQFMMDLTERFLKPLANPRGKLLTVYVFTNIFCHQVGRKWGVYFKLFLLEAMTSMSEQPEPALVSAIFKFVLNLTVAMNELQDTEAWERILDQILQFISVVENPEHQFNLVVAMGTLFSALPARDKVQFIQSLLNAKKVMELLKRISKSAPTQDVEVNLKRAVREFLALTFC